MSEDKRLPMKVVGRHGAPKVDVVTFAPVQNAFAASPQGRTFMRKGVFRFKSFEEEDEWITKLQTEGRRGEQMKKQRPIVSMERRPLLGRLIITFFAILITHLFWLFFFSLGKK
jgi:hypothetical protein